jgi:hypothetical protein
MIGNSTEDGSHDEMKQLSELHRSSTKQNFTDVKAFPSWINHLPG